MTSTRRSPKAEAEAHDYAAAIEEAPSEYLGIAQAYALSDTPDQDGAEVFSLIRDNHLDGNRYLDAFFRHRARTPALHHRSARLMCSRRAAVVPWQPRVRVFLADAGESKTFARPLRTARGCRTATGKVLGRRAADASVHQGPVAAGAFAAEPGTNPARDRWSSHNHARTGAPGRATAHHRRPTIPQPSPSVVDS